MMMQQIIVIIVLFVSCSVFGLLYVLYIYIYIVFQFVICTHNQRHYYNCPAAAQAAVNDKITREMMDKVVCIDVTQRYDYRKLHTKNKKIKKRDKIVFE